MARLKRNIEVYTSVGKLLDRLCREKAISYRELARRSGTSQSSLVRTSLGTITPERDTILKWCEALGCMPSERAELLHAFNYASPEDLVTSNLEEEAGEKA